MLCAVYVLCFDNLRVLLDGLFLLFALIFLSFVVRLQDPVFDPGVSGTVVGSPVSLWSCVLLMLRHAVSVPFCFSGVAVCCSCFCIFARVAQLSVSFCGGCAWGVLFFFRVLLSNKRVCSSRRPLSSMH